MKKILFILILSVMLMPTLVSAETVDLAPNAKSAIMIEASTGEVIFEKNIHEKLAPASMTKMMSMLLFIENIKNGNLKWDEKITASANASSMGGSQIFLETGEVMTVEELLKGVSVASGNDATVALAERIAGTEENFVKMMNERAKELGLKNTEFKNATGLDIANHYSSAYDMSLIAKELVKHEEILKFTGTYEDYLRTNTENKFWLVNTNKLVRFYQGVDGLKTGYTKEAGYCLTATASKDGMRLITVVMGEEDSSTRNSETTKMLDYGFNMYTIEKMLSTNSSLGMIEVDKGKIEQVDIVPMEDVNILNTKTGEKRNVTYEMDLYNIKAPVKNGEEVGKLNIIENGKNIKSIGITIKEDVEKANFFEIYFRYLKKILSQDINIG